MFSGVTPFSSPLSFLPPNPSPLLLHHYSLTCDKRIHRISLDSLYSYLRCCQMESVVFFYSKCYTWNGFFGLIMWSRFPRESYSFPFKIGMHQFMKCISLLCLLVYEQHIQSAGSIFWVTVVYIDHSLISQSFNPVQKLNSKSSTHFFLHCNRFWASST